MRKPLNSGNLPPSTPAELSERERGDQARDARHWTDAVEHYTAHLAADPDDFGILVQLGNCSKESGHFDVAHQSYERAIAIDGRDADVRVQLGHLLKITGRLEEAIESYGCAMAIDPAHRDAMHERDALLAAIQNNNRPNLKMTDLGMPHFADLNELIEYLRKYPFRARLFREYFCDFIPS